MSGFSVSRLNHAVLYVRSAKAAAEFYAKAFGFVAAGEEFARKAIFMRAATTENHHDLGLFEVGPDAPRTPRGALGSITWPGR